MNTNTTKNEKKNINKAIKASLRNKRAAWRYFEKHGFADHGRMVLHHNDTELKNTDPERYHAWNVEDLTPMTVQEHRRLHMKIEDHTHTKGHNRRISAAMKSRTRFARIVLSRSTVETYEFKTMKAAADFVGCSKQLIS